MTSHFFLKKLEEFARDTLKALEIVRTTFRQMSHLSTDGNLIKKKTLWPLFMDGVQLPQG